MIYTIKDELNKYLEFDSSILFNSTDFIVVFGGALRDIIAGDSDDINDIDIMCLPKSRNIATDVLLSKGYKKLQLFTPDLFCLYKDIRCIFEPKTFVKGDKIVQLITPAVYSIDLHNKSNYSVGLIMQKNFFTLLKNVDMSSSGVVYDGKCLYESVKGSVDLIKNKKFFTMSDSLMYNKDRLTIRLNNLIYKGWTQLKTKDIVFERAIKISSIRSNFPFIDNLEKSMVEDEYSIFRRR